MIEASPYGAGDEYATLTNAIERTRESLDLVLPDEASIIQLQQKNMFAALSSLASGKRVRVRVVCVFSQKTQTTIREFFPFIQFKSIGSSMDSSRIIAIRDQSEVLFFEPHSVDSMAGSSSPQGPLKEVEKFDVSSNPLLVKAWIQVFDGLLRQREQVEALVSERYYTGFLLDLLSHDVGNYNQIILSLLENAQDEVARGDTSDKAEEKLAEILTRARQTLGRSLLFVANVRLFGILHREKATELKAVDLLSSVEESARRVNLKKTVVMTPAARQKKLYVRLLSDPISLSERPFVMADELLVELFFNLFANALKYTGGEVVTVDVGLEERRIGATHFWEVSVIDYGAGIPDALKEGIFRRFSDHSSGNGLGLAIVDGLVRRYEGEIWVEDSVYGDHSKGAAFGLLLKRANAPGAAKENPEGSRAMPSRSDSGSP